MKEILENLVGFIYLLSMGDYFFFIGTFLLIVLFIYVLYLIKCSDEEEKEKSEIKSIDGFDIEAVSKAIENDYKPETIKLTSYEMEQENTAIISYEELVKNKDRFNYNYDDEYTFPASEELSVKKFDLNSFGELDHENTKKLEPKLFSYDKEEAFLKALKSLQNNL